MGTEAIFCVGPWLAVPRGFVESARRPGPHHLLNEMRSTCHLTIRFNSEFIRRARSSSHPPRPARAPRGRLPPPSWSRLPHTAARRAAPGRRPARARGRAPEPRAGARELHGCRPSLRRGPAGALGRGSAARRRGRAIASLVRLRHIPIPNQRLISRLHKDSLCR